MYTSKPILIIEFKVDILYQCKTKKHFLFSSYSPPFSLSFLYYSNLTRTGSKPRSLIHGHLLLIKSMTLMKSIIIDLGSTSKTKGMSRHITSLLKQANTVTFWA